MIDPIKVGDLVVVVKATPCCNVYRPLKTIFMVEEIRKDINSNCVWCKKTRQVICVYYPDSDMIIDIDRLKKIPPAEKLGLVNEREKVKA